MCSVVLRQGYGEGQSNYFLVPNLLNERILIHRLPLGFPIRMSFHHMLQLHITDSSHPADLRLPWDHCKSSIRLLLELLCSDFSGHFSSVLFV